MHRCGVKQVVEQLGGCEDRASHEPTADTDEADPLAPEPKPVSNLRDYSNYLTAIVGLFSGDTWSAAATIFRNLLLNWLVLLPLLGAIIGAPLLFLLFIRTPDITKHFAHTLLITALAIELAPACSCIPRGDSRRAAVFSGELRLHMRAAHLPRSRISCVGRGGFAATLEQPPTVPAQR